MTKFFEETWFWWWLLAVVAILRSYSPVVVTHNEAGQVSRAEPHSATTKHEPSAL
jgi:hypothetical protein